MLYLFSASDKNNKKDGTIPKLIKMIKDLFQFKTKFYSFPIKHRDAHVSLLLHGGAGSPGTISKRPADSVRRRALPPDHRRGHEDEDEELQLLLPPHSCAGLRSRGIWMASNDLTPKLSFGGSLIIKRFKLSNVVCIPFLLCGTFLCLRMLPLIT